MPAIAKPNDLNYDLAYRAHCGTSMVPDRRAKDAQQAYADDVNGLYAELEAECTNDEQRRILAEQMDRYRQSYLKHFGAYLSSHGNVMSAMITGPSNFPTARNEKRSRWAHNKLEAFLEWRKKARQAVRRAILDARTIEEVEAVEWEKLRKEVDRSLAVIQGIDAGGSFYTRSAFVNSIVGKVERLARNGEVGLVDKAVALVAEYNERHKKPAISKRHKFWTFADLAREHQQKHDEKLDRPIEVVLTGDGFSIQKSFQEDRVQILFDERPPAELRRKLRGVGWNWSRQNKAWQRKLTDNAVASATEMVESFVPADAVARQLERSEP